MKIEIKNLKLGPEWAHQETLMFSADVYIEGKKSAYAKNEGHGGSTHVQPYDKDSRELMNKAEAYLATLPEKKVSDDFSMQEKLEDVVDGLVYAVYNEKQRVKMLNKIKRACVGSIVFGTDSAYQTLGWRGVTIEEMLATPRGKSMLRASILEVKAKLKKGEQIFNTNLGDLL